MTDSRSSCSPLPLTLALLLAACGDDGPPAAPAGSTSTTSDVSVDLVSPNKDGNLHHHGP